jgi:hypothetical protein
MRTLRNIVFLSCFLFTTSALGQQVILQGVYNPLTDDNQTFLIDPVTGLPSQQCYMSDGTGTPITSTGGKLDVAMALPAGGATEAKQDDAIALLTTIDADTSKIPASPATAGAQATGNMSLSAIEGDSASMALNNATKANQVLQLTDSGIIAGDTTAISVDTLAIAADTAQLVIDMVSLLADTAAMLAKLPTLEDGMQPTIAYPVMISKGLVAGHVALNKFGYNPAVGVDWEPIWEGSAVYDFLSVEEEFKIKSDSVEDDTDKGGAVPGTGAFTVEVQCINQAGAQVVQVYTLNGQTAVDMTLGDCLIAYRARVLTAGTGGANDGTITIYQNDGATAQLLITPFNNQSLQALWPVPAGKTLYITHINASEVGNQNVEVGLFVMELGELFQIKQHAIFKNEVWERPLRYPIVAGPQSVVYMGARALVGSGNVSAMFDGWYE